MRGFAVPILGGAASFELQLTEFSAKVFAMYRKTALPVEGYTNRVVGEYGETLGYVLMADLDNVEDARDIIPKLEFAHDKIGFGDAYLIMSGFKNYHVLVPTIHTLEEAAYFSILMGGGHSIDLLMGDKEQTFRISAKNGMRPEFIARYRFPFEGMYSRPHIQLLKTEYKCGLLPKGSMNGIKLDRKKYFYYNRRG